MRKSKLKMMKYWRKTGSQQIIVAGVKYLQNGKSSIL